jgi:hypothetical protein
MHALVSGEGAFVERTRVVQGRASIPPAGERHAEKRNS